MSTVCDGFVRVTATNTDETLSQKGVATEEPAGIVSISYAELLDPSTDISAKIEQVRLWLKTSACRELTLKV